MNTRYKILDEIRGITLISMVLYHGAWDLVYLYGRNWAWYGETPGYIWQQSICWTFILLSGFCWSMGRRRLRRGLIVFGSGALITAVTLLFMPENRVVFGVLTLLGSCMLLLIPLERALKRIPAMAGLVGSAVLFFLLRNVGRGYLGFEGLRFARLPQGLYQNLGTAYLGFPGPDFFSVDYFGLLPWFFLFLTGYFLHRIFVQKGWLAELGRIGLGQSGRPFGWIGRHSLLIYLLHQPALFLLMELVRRL